MSIPERTNWLEPEPIVQHCEYCFGELPEYGPCPACEHREAEQREEAIAARIDEAEQRFQRELAEGQKGVAR